MAIMQSHALFSPNNCRNVVQIGILSDSFSRPKLLSLYNCQKFGIRSFPNHKVGRLLVSRRRCQRHGYGARGAFRVRATDDDSAGVSFSDGGYSDRSGDYIFSSSEGEDSDGEMLLQPIPDIDLPTSKDRSSVPKDSITATAHRFGMLGREQKKKKILFGMLNNFGLVSFSTILLLLVDQCAWRIVRLPLAPFHLMRPFLISVASVICVGYVCVPLFRILKLRSMYTRPTRNPSKKGTPTMGGVYFVPIGLLVAEFVLGFSSIDVSGAVVATIALAAIGLLDDSLSLNNSNNNSAGLSRWLRTLLQVAVGIGFSYWLFTTNISTPYSMKMVIPLPPPLGLVCAGKIYPILTSICFLSMTNGIDLTDGLDGLAAGTAALAFIGMSIVVLPICSDLAVFGSSMAGACVGFLFQNRYKASIFMGDTGALALGGALAAMASCTGMFFPLFISSGVFILEALSVFIQVSSFKATKLFRRTGYKFFRMAPLHHHLELCGIKEPVIVAVAYAVTSVLILCAAYVGLTSV